MSDIVFTRLLCYPLVSLPSWFGVFVSYFVLVESFVFPAHLCVCWISLDDSIQTPRSGCASDKYDTHCAHTHTHIAILIIFHSSSYFPHNSAAFLRLLCWKWRSQLPTGRNHFSRSRLEQVWVSLGSAGNKLPRIDISIKLYDFLQFLILVGFQYYAHRDVCMHMCLNIKCEDNFMVRVRWKRLLFTNTFMSMHHTHLNRLNHGLILF